MSNVFNSIISVDIMSLQKLRKKIEYYPELLSVILFFGRMMIQPVSEQYLYQVFSEKHGVPYNFNNNKTGCPSTNNSSTNVTSTTHQVRKFSISFIWSIWLAMNIFIWLYIATKLTWRLRGGVNNKTKILQSFFLRVFFNFP